MARATIRTRVEKVPVLPMKRRGVQGVRIDLRIIRTPSRYYITGLDADGHQVTNSREPMDNVEDVFDFLIETVKRLTRESEHAATA